MLHYLWSINLSLSLSIQCVSCMPSARARSPFATTFVRIHPNESGNHIGQCTQWKWRSSSIFRVHVFNFMQPKFVHTVNTLECWRMFHYITGKLRSVLWFSVASVSLSSLQELIDRQFWNALNCNCESKTRLLWLKLAIENVYFVHVVVVAFVVCGPAVG